MAYSKTTGHDRARLQNIAHYRTLLYTNRARPAHDHARPLNTMHYSALPRSDTHKDTLTHINAYFTTFSHNTAHYRALPRTTAHNYATTETRLLANTAHFSRVRTITHILDTLTHINAHFSTFSHNTRIISRYRRP